MIWAIVGFILSRFDGNVKNEPMVHREGLEPTTLCSEDRCSNPLSYRCLGYIIAHFGVIEKGGGNTWSVW